MATVTLKAPSTIPVGSQVVLRDGTNTTVGAAGTITVDVSNQAALLNGGWQLTMGAGVSGVSNSNSAPEGYGTGAGGAVTQASNRTAAVTLNTLSGQITTNNASLAAEAAAKFTVSNSLVAIGDVIACSQQSGSNGGNTAVNVVAVAAGSFDLQVSNNNASGGTAETGAIIINYVVLKGAAA